MLQARVITASLFLLACSNAPAVFAKPRYHLIPLGDVPGGGFNSTAGGVNDGQQVTGRGYDDEGAQVFLWDPENGMQPLDDVDGFGYDINNLGQITGASAGAFFWDPVTGVHALGD